MAWIQTHQHGAEGMTLNCEAHRLAQDITGVAKAAAGKGELEHVTRQTSWRRPSFRVPNPPLQPAAP